MSNNGIRRNFKRINRIMESSGTGNIDHRTMDKGMHEGTSAMGEYGLMPVTAQDLVKNSSDPLDQIIKNADPSQVEEILKGNPQAYDRLVDKQMDKIVKKTEDPLEAAVLWNSGPNLSPDRVQRHIASDPNDFTSRTEKAIDQARPMSTPPDIYEYIQSLKDFDDFKNKKRDKLYNPKDLDKNDVKLKIPRK